jgi:hypothetical protein
MAPELLYKTTPVAVGEAAIATSKITQSSGTLKVAGDVAAAAPEGFQHN